MYKYIGLLHSLFSCFISFYGFIIPKNDFDIYYIIYQFIVVISWTFYNGECLLTYYIKKCENKDYVAGKESVDLKDMYMLFGSKENTYLLVSIFIIINAFSIFIVLRRMGFPQYIYYSLPLLHFLYAISLRVYPYNLHENKYFLISQEIFKFVFIILFIITLYLYSMKNVR